MAKTPLLLIFAVLLLRGTDAQFNFTTCQEKLTSGQFGLEGATDRYGNPFVGTNTSAIEGYLYSYCVKNCGDGSEYYAFNEFAQQFTLWLLPWLTLLAQIPYATKTAWADPVVMLLTIGSPTTALFSMLVTMFDRMWLQNKCDAIRRDMNIDAEDKTLQEIAAVMHSLHQFPIEIEEAGLLACTLAVPKNNRWWRGLSVWFLARRRQMEASAWAQLTLSVLIYLIAVLPEAFADLGGN
jgi:hypothetical protein